MNDPQCQLISSTNINLIWSSHRFFQKNVQRNIVYAMGAMNTISSLSGFNLLSRFNKLSRLIRLRRLSWFSWFNRLSRHNKLRRLCRLRSLFIQTHQIQQTKQTQHTQPTQQTHRFGWTIFWNQQTGIQLRHKFHRHDTVGSGVLLWCCSLAWIVKSLHSSYFYNSAKIMHCLSSLPPFTKWGYIPIFGNLLFIMCIVSL